MRFSTKNRKFSMSVMEINFFGQKKISGYTICVSLLVLSIFSDNHGLKIFIFLMENDICGQLNLYTVSFYRKFYAESRIWSFNF